MEARKSRASVPSVTPCSKLYAGCPIVRSCHSLGKKSVSVSEDCGLECRRKPAGADLHPHSSELSQVPSLFLSSRRRGNLHVVTWELLRRKSVASQ
jgi:hypothetical protein